jgi:hypothetical protein
MADALQNTDPKLLKMLLALSQLLLKKKDGRAQLTRMLKGIRDVMGAFGQGQQAGASLSASLQRIFAATGSAAKQGTTSSLSISVQQTTIEVHSQSINLQIDLVTGQVQQQKGDPLVLDLDRDGVELTGIADGVNFDINASGKAERTAFVKPDDGLLVMDRDGNGNIDNATELFGDQNGRVNGFADLARYDRDKNGVIDGRDPVYQYLMVFRDRNQDGRSTPDELASLSSAGIASLSLKAQEINQSLGVNTLAQAGTYQRFDGTSGMLADVLLGYVTA